MFGFDKLVKLHEQKSLKIMETPVKYNINLDVKYPHLERVDGTADMLSDIMRAHAAAP